MYIIASFDCKFKTNKENIENTLHHYGLRKIQATLYAGELENNEREFLAKNISKIIRETGSFLIIPVCRNCYMKKEQYGRKIKFKNDLYRVYQHETCN